MSVPKRAVDQLDLAAVDRRRRRSSRRRSSCAIVVDVAEVGGQAGLDERGLVDGRPADLDRVVGDPGAVAAAASLAASAAGARSESALVHAPSSISRDRAQRRGSPRRVPSSAHRSPSSTVAPSSGSRTARYGDHLIVSMQVRGLRSSDVSARCAPGRSRRPDADEDEMPRAQRVTGQDVADRAGRLEGDGQLRPQRRAPVSRSRPRPAPASSPPPTSSGYTPHAAARQLRTGVSDLILLALPPWPLSHALSLCVVHRSPSGWASSATPRSSIRPPRRSTSLEQHARPRAAGRARRQRRAPLRAARRPPARPRAHARCSASAIVRSASRPTVVFDQTAITRVAMTHLAEPRATDPSSPSCPTTRRSSGSAPVARPAPRRPPPTPTA